MAMTATVPTATTPLRRLLEARGIKQTWLAQQVGVSEMVMSLWCRELGVSPEYVPLVIKALNQFPKVTEKDIRP
jgi:hypothetical protein